MSSFDFSDVDINVDEWEDYIGKAKWNAVYTIQLGELIESGVFDWSSDALSWEGAAYDSEQYARVCEYFEKRFYYREISIEPFKEWAMRLQYKLVYELMPKYKPLYERESEGVNPLAGSNEYYKNRTIQSAYPETLLSENADYITDGKDEEYQRIKEADYASAIADYAEKTRSIDKMLVDELESLFICLYTSNVNGSW